MSHTIENSSDREVSRLVSAELRLKELGIKLPVPPEPFGTCAEAVQSGNLLFLSGMLPTEGRVAKFIGRVGAELDVKSLATTRTRHVGNDSNVERYDPDRWTDEFYFLNQPGQADMQSDLFYDYRTNVDSYPKWQAWMREKQPRLLVSWGKYDLSFDPGEPERYRKDGPNAEVHVLDAGHFALDTAADEIAALVRAFVTSSRGELQARRAS
jgi:pimeloyl-ACP methyl ester carboxylesterase